MKNRLYQLDGLRVIMCAIVVISHFEFLNDGSKLGDIYHLIFYRPTLAVDYFFMLSGFGLYYSYNKKYELETSFFSCIKFAINKIKKVYSAYVFSLVMGIISIVINSYLKNGLVILNVTEILRNLLLCLTMTQSLTGIVKITHAINGVCWFMSCLFICYMFCPLFIKFVNRIENKKELKKQILLAVILIMILSSIETLSYILFGNFIFNDYYDSHPIIRCLYLLLGMYAAYIRISFNKNYNFDTKSEIIMMLIFVVYITLRNIISYLIFEDIIRIFDIIICFSLLIVFSFGGGKLSKHLSGINIIRISRNVIYIYLFHYPIRNIVNDLFVSFGFFGIYTELIQALLIIVLTFITIKFYKLIFRK